MIINFFSVPDKEKNFQSYMVYVLALIWSIVTGVIVSIGFIYFPELWSRWLTYLILSVLIAIFNLELNRKGYTRLASWSLTIMFWIYITVPCYSAGGIMAPGILSQMSIILTAGFLLGWRGGVAIGLLSLGVDLWFAHLEIDGLLPVPSVNHDPITRWIATLIPFGTIIILQYHATHHLRSGLIALELEIEKREEAEKIKDQTVFNLGERVKELQTLYAVGQLLQKEQKRERNVFKNIVDIIPKAFRYPHLAQARLNISTVEYITDNYRESIHSLSANMVTKKGTPVKLEVNYTCTIPNEDEHPFLEEERNLINMLVEMIKINLEGKEGLAELKEYKYALDIAAIVSISEVNGTYSFVNTNFCDISQYSEEELLGEHYSVIWANLYTPEFFAELKTSMEKGKHHRGEFCNRAKDGTLYWVDTTIVPFLDEKGNVYQYLSINRDITARKEATASLRESREKYKSIITVSNTGAWEYNVETKQVWYSAQYFEMLGISKPLGAWEDSMDTTWIAKLHPDDKESSIKLFDDYLKGGSRGVYESFFRMRHNEGYWVWIWARARRLRDNNSKLTNITLGTHIDISERKKAEQDIKQSEQLLKKITSQVPGNTYMFQIDELGNTQTLFFNHGSDQNIPSPGSKDFEMLTHRLNESIYEEDKSLWRETMKKAYLSQSNISFQYRIWLNDDIRWIWFKAVPEKKNDGKLMWYGAAQDITPIVDYITSIEQILFDISHIIRKPVSNILGLTEIMKNQELNKKEIKEVSKKLNLVAEEMDIFLSELNNVYDKKRLDTNLNIDISELIDRRNNLFNQS